GTRDTTAAGGSLVTTNETLGITSGDLHLTDSAHFHETPVSGPDSTTYYSGANGTASNPVEPALPRYVANVDVPSKVLRGVGFLGGAYAETPSVKPFIGAPGTEFGGAQTPFTSPTFYPGRMWAASYFAELSGGATNLSVTPAHHRVANVGASTAIRRLYSSLDLRLFYADASGPNAASAALATAPSISRVLASAAGTTVNFEATVNGTSPTGADNLKSVWLTYTTAPSGCSCWQSVDLTRTAGTNKFTGSATIGAGDQAALRFLVQAANAAAMVGVEDNDGAYYSLANAKEVVLAPATTTLHLGSVPASAAYGATIPVSATLTDGSGPLSGRVISFRIGTAIGY